MTSTHFTPLNPHTGGITYMYLLCVLFVRWQNGGNTPLCRVVSPFVLLAQAVPSGEYCNSNHCTATEGPPKSSQMALLCCFEGSKKILPGAWDWAEKWSPGRHCLGGGCPPPKTVDGRRRLKRAVGSSKGQGPYIHFVLAGHRGHLRQHHEGRGGPVGRGRLHKWGFGVRGPEESRKRKT